MRGNLFFAREFLLEIHTSLAIATSALRTNLLLQDPPFQKPPIRFSRWFSWASRDIPIFWASSFTWKTPTPPEGFPDQKVGFGFLILRRRKLGAWIRRVWILRLWGAPIFRPEVPKPFKNKYLGSSGLKIEAPQKREIQPRQIQLPILGPLILLPNDND